MSEYSGFILANRNTLGPYNFVGCHRMSESQVSDCTSSTVSLYFTISVNQKSGLIEMAFGWSGLIRGGQFSSISLSQ